MEFNPDFSFDLGGADDGISHPWEFQGALSQAHGKDPRQTSVCEKIEARLKGKPARKQKEAGRASQAGGQAQSSSDSEGHSEDDPLPGEEMSDGETRHMKRGHSGPVRGGSKTTSDRATPATKKSAESAPLRARAPAGGVNKGAIKGKASKANTPAKAQVDEMDDSDESDMDAADDGSKRTAGAPSMSNRQESVAASAEEERRDSNSAASFFAPAPAGTSFTASGFADLGLSRPLVKACAALGYTTPTPIQAACIPLALLGRDIVASAITGSGKTAAFALPLLERLLFRSKRIAATHVLVLAPARELAVQVHSMICTLARFTDVSAAIVVGGLSLQRQAAELRQAPDIVVATPGRIIDHVMNTMSFELDSLSALVLDEADRLLELGFQEEIRQLLRLTPQRRQTLLFSATMSDRVQELIALSLSSPVRLSADARAAAPALLRQEVVRLKGASAASKDAVLMALCARSLHTSRTIIFCAQKWKAHRLRVLMGLAELPLACELHGDMTQGARLEALEQFRTGEARFLLATDVAARGLDILGVDSVVNYDCPPTVDSYLHRIGRTARAGARGLAVSLVEDGDRTLVKGVVKQVKAKLLERAVPTGVVETWRKRLEALTPQVDAVIDEERQEKELRKAEMEATKASNMMEYEAEIHSRPKREWFLSSKQKKDVQAAARKVVATLPDTDVASTKPQSKDKGARDARNAASKGGGARATQRAPPSHVSETRGEMGPVKAAKAAARKMQHDGQKPKESSAAALTAIGVVKRDKQRKNGAKRKADSLDDDISDAAKQRRTTTHVYAGGGKSAAVSRGPSGGKSKVDKARLARGGKGKSQFKGKAKHKRR